MSQNKKRKIPPSEKLPPEKMSKSEVTETPNSNKCNFLKDCNIYVLQTGIGKARCDLFNKQIVNNGGTFESTFGPTVTHAVVDEKMEVDRMCRILKIDVPPSKTRIVKSLWLSTCLKEKKYVNTEHFEIKKVISKVEPNPEDVKTTDPSSGPSHVADSKANPVETEDDGSKDSDKDREKTGRSKVKYPQVGNMYRFTTKAKPKAEASADDVDSDYVPSGDEDDDIQEAPDSSSPPSSQSMQRRLPVCTMYFQLPIAIISPNPSELIGELIVTNCISEKVMCLVMFVCPRGWVYPSTRLCRGYPSTRPGWGVSQHAPGQRWVSRHAFVQGCVDSGRILLECILVN